MMKGELTIFPGTDGSCSVEFVCLISLASINSNYHCNTKTVIEDHWRGWET